MGTCISTLETERIEYIQQSPSLRTKKQWIQIWMEEVEHEMIIYEEIIYFINNKTFPENCIIKIKNIEKYEKYTEEDIEFFNDNIIKFKAEINAYLKLISLL